MFSLESVTETANLLKRHCLGVNSIGYQRVVINMPFEGVFFTALDVLLVCVLQNWPRLEARQTNSIHCVALRHYKESQQDMVCQIALLIRGDN